MSRFPLPWTVHSNSSCFWVEDSEGHKLAYTYFKEAPDFMLGQLTRDEARRIAANIAKLPGLLGRARE